MNSAARIFAFAVTFAPLVMRFIFLLAAIILWLKVRTLPTAMIALGVGLGILAPSPKAPAFAITQLLVLAIFLVLGWAAVKGFRTEHAAIGR
jgi:hypothetical protein